MLTDSQWDEYASAGYLRLGPILGELDLVKLRQRADELALGTVSNADIRLQRDTGGAYDELPAVTESFDEPTLQYRKVQGLETDECFAPLVRHELFREICGHVYGHHTSQSIFRAMIMNKPASLGTHLPWHQDGGDVWALDRDPLVTIWVALDAANVANGCMEIVPGSHKRGLLSRFGSTVVTEEVERYCTPDDVIALPVEAGHGVLLHNWLLHRSGVNSTDLPRRAFTACFMDARTRSSLTGNLFPIVHGSVDDDPPLYLRQVREENATLRTSRASAEEYAWSLEAERVRLEAVLAQQQDARRPPRGRLGFQRYGRDSN